MQSSILAIFAALGESISHAWANILDNYLSNKIFERLPLLIFFSAVANVLFLPIILILDFPKSVSLTAFLLILVIACIETFYQYPYYVALRKADTSVIASLFSLGDIFTPLLAFLLIGEQLHVTQYVGFFMVVGASLLLTLDIRKFKLNSASVLMLVVSLVLVLESIFYKSLFNQGVSWGSAIFWITILQLGIASLCFIFSRNRKDFKTSANTIRKVGWLFVFIQFLSWGGEALSSYALLILPVSVTKGITGLQPVFVLVFALLFSKKFPKLFKEEVQGSTLYKKLALFTVMIIGVVLIVLK